MANTHTCPICERPIVVRVGVIAKHPKSGKPYVARKERRPRPVEWCDASSRRWDQIVKKP